MTPHWQLPSPTLSAFKETPLGMPAFHLLLLFTVQNPCPHRPVSRKQAAQQVPPFDSDIAQATRCPVSPHRVQPSTICPSPAPTQGMPTRHRYSQAWPGTVKIITPGRCSALGLERLNSSDPPDNDRRTGQRAWVHVARGSITASPFSALPIILVVVPSFSGQTPFLSSTDKQSRLLDCKYLTRQAV